MMRLWNCDDDGQWVDDESVCWEEIEEFAGPEYLMWRDKLDEESPTPTWRPAPQTYVYRDNWRRQVC